MKKILIISFTLLLCLSLTSCKKAENVSVDTTGTTKEPPKVYTNPLTGLETSSDLASTRPVAVMINNHKKSMPHMGISKADLYFEIPAEGELNRLMPIFTDYKDIPVIGTVRSSRDYFLHFALPLDAIYIHYGGSPAAYNLFKTNKIDHFDGINGAVDRSMFWRDSTRRKKYGLEHSAMTSGEKIVATFKKYETRTTLSNDFTAPFLFNDNDTPAGDLTANEVNAYYSYYITGRFVYDTNKKLYKRYQFEVPHIDGNTNEQLTVKNVIIMFTDVNAIAGDKKNRQELRTTGTGTGYYISNGTATAIEWSKTNMNSKLYFKDSAGNEIKVNKGKTWVCIIPEKVKNKTNIS